jgi:hypothetical protein
MLLSTVIGFPLVSWVANRVASFVENVPCSCEIDAETFLGVAVDVCVIPLTSRNPMTTARTRVVAAPPTNVRRLDVVIMVPPATDLWPAHLG